MWTDRCHVDVRHPSSWPVLPVREGLHDAYPRTPVAESGCTHGGLNTNLSPFSNSKRVTANAKQDLRNRGAYSIRPANLPCTFNSSSLGGASEAPGRSSSGGNPSKRSKPTIACRTCFLSSPTQQLQASITTLDTLVPSNLLFRLPYPGTFMPAFNVCMDHQRA